MCYGMAAEDTDKRCTTDRGSPGREGGGTQEGLHGEKREEKAPMTHPYFPGFFPFSSK